MPDQTVQLKPRHLRLYRAETDAMLCRYAQAGDDKAAEALLARHEGWIIRTARKWRIAGYEDDDILAAAQAGFADAIRKFDTAGQVKLVTFAFYTMRKHIDRLALPSRRVKNGANELSPLSLNTGGYDNDGAPCEIDLEDNRRSVEAIVIGRTEAERLRKVLATTEERAIVLDATIANESVGQKAMAELTGIGEARLKSLRFMLQKALRRELERYE